MKYYRHVVFAFLFTVMVVSHLAQAEAQPANAQAQPTSTQAQPANAQAQAANPQAPPANQQHESAPLPTIKAETRLVLVDTIVTDKKGNYIRDLTQKDFRVWEDNKEQPVKNFSLESDAAGSSQDQRRYMVLFFDDSTMASSNQSQARAAALKFLDTNVGKDRYIAVVDFGGTMRVVQNFTTDGDRLKQAVRDLKFASTSPNPEPQVGAVASVAPDVGVPQIGGGLRAGGTQVGNLQATFGARTLLMALRDLAKGLASVPGRKSLVMLSEGFPLNPADPNLPEIMSELTAVIDTCNKNNIAIYPIDVRGLITPIGAAPQIELPMIPADDEGRLMDATLHLSDGEAPAHLLLVQHGGSGGGGGGGGGGGHSGGGGGVGSGGGGTGGHTGGTGSGSGGRTGTGSTGSRGYGGGGGGVPFNPLPNTPYAQARGLLPDSAFGNEKRDVLYDLAAGTGGFVIVNSNDLLGGLEKIAQEQGQYYLVGYTPPESEEGTCHTLKVKIDRPGVVVRSRTGYCNVKPNDLLAGRPVEKQLENQVKGSQPGTIAASMLAPYFYTSANTARVNLAIEIPSSAIKFNKEKGKQHAQISVLGIAYGLDGGVAARFSDQVDLNFESKSEMQEFLKKPYHYENQFEVAAGKYNLKVGFSSGGDSFGKLEMPLIVDNFDTKQFAISALALSKELHPLSQVESGLDAALLEDRTPLVAQGMEIIPAGSNRFTKSDTAVFYVEIYAPMLIAEKPPQVGIQMVVMDQKSGEKKLETGGPAATAKAGNPIVPVGLRLPVDKLPPGAYQLEVRGIDSTGKTTAVRTANFQVD